MTGRHRVVIVGGGFAGLAAAKVLRPASVDVTVVDRQAHHLFQPLLYQVATGVLSQGNVAPPLRYRDLGSFGAVSRYNAIGERGRARVWGLAGWLAWLFVHLTFLTGFKNRVSALFNWMISFFGALAPRADDRRAAGLRPPGAGCIRSRR